MEIMQYLTIGTLVFFILNLLNVMLCTAKSILTVKSTRGIATIINAVAYGYYAMIIKQIGDQDLIVVVIATIIANLIGVYFSLWLLDKFKKDKLWVVRIAVTMTDYLNLKEELISDGLGFNEYVITTKYGESVGMDIFSHNQKESQELRELLEKYKVKYYIIESRNSL